MMDAGSAPSITWVCMLTWLQRLVDAAIAGAVPAMTIAGTDHRALELSWRRDKVLRAVFTKSPLIPKWHASAPLCALPANVPC